MSASLIISMAAIGVGCAVAEKVLNSFGKMDAAQFVNIAGLSGIGIIALTLVVKLFKTIGTLF